MDIAAVDLDFSFSFRLPARKRTASLLWVRIGDLEVRNGDLETFSSLLAQPPGFPPSLSSEELSSVPLGLVLGRFRLREVEADQGRVAVFLPAEVFSSVR